MPVFQEKDRIFTPAEIEFFAEDELVTIVPNFSFDTSNGCLQGLEGIRYGPFRPNTATDVPLWLAIALKRRNRCEILKPMWLEVDVLEEMFEKEKSDGTEFQPLPPHYIEISQILFRHSKTTFKDDLRKTKELVDSIIKRRMHKLELGMSELTGPVTVKLNNLSVMELNTIRPFFQIALQRFHEFAQLETSLETRTGTYGSSTLGSTPATEQTPARRLRR